MGRKSFLSMVLLTPVKSEITRRIKKKTKAFVGKAFEEPRFKKISARKALEFDRKRLRIGR